MTSTLQDLKVASGALPQSERAELAHFLLESLEPPDQEWAEAWRDELNRRMADIRSGAAIGIPIEEALKQSRRPGYWSRRKPNQP